MGHVHLAPTTGRPHTASPCEVRRVPILYERATTVTFAHELPAHDRQQLISMPSGL